MKQIPSDWNVVRGKDFLFLRNRPVREDDDVVTCFRDGEVILRSERRTEGFTMSDKEIGYQGINKGDIVIHGMDGFAGAMGVSKSTGKGSPVLIVCNPKSDDDARYIIYYLRTLAMNNVFVALATGIRERSCDLRWNKISVLPFVRPSFLEQKRIADFIEKKSEEIDSLITLQEQMIEKLKAYKLSVITEAVTKGLNPNAKLVPSGIEWIGEIPEGWKMIRGKYLFSVLNGYAFDSNKFTDDKTCMPLIRIRDINKETTECYYSGSYPNEYTVKRGELLVGMDGDFNVARWKGNDALLNQRVCKIIDFSDKICNGLYIYYLLPLLLKRKNEVTYSTTVKHLSSNDIIRFSFLIPPLSDQRSIASYLDEKCADIDRLIALKQRKIESLKDYKKSVIYEAVTGKSIIE